MEFEQENKLSKEENFTINAQLLVKDV